MRPYARLAAGAQPRQRHHKAQEASVAPLLAAFVAARPTQAHRLNSVLLGRELRAEAAVPVTHKHVWRTMQAHGLLLTRRYTVRPDDAHDAKVVMLHSNLRSPSGSADGAFAGSLLRQLRVHLARKGEVVRGAFLNDADDLR